MFERYTEKARRVIFFAALRGQSVRLPLHRSRALTARVLREDHPLARKVLGSGGTPPEPSIESIKRKVSERGMLGKKFPTSVDLPLSNESKRVLAYAAEEAERLAHRHIGTEHLLLGLLREKKSFAAQLLNEEGVLLERSREKIAEWQKKYAGDEVHGIQEIVHIHGEAWDLSNIEERVQDLVKFAWRRREWSPLDVLIDSETGHVCFDVEPPHESNFRLVSGGWPRERCLICRWELNADGGEDHSVGYTNGRGWICAQCYEQFLSNKSQAS
jgi:hypothetical protein